MKIMTFAAALVCVAGAAVAEPTIQWLPSGFLVTDLSQDGTVAVGNQVNDGSYETFRWDASSGAVRLGRASLPAIGIAGGSPDVSYDGTRVSASIVSTDANLTLGIWNSSTGWDEAMPPLPADAAPIDQEYGSAWGLSGNGAWVTGYYRGQRAQSCRWSVTGGMVALPKIASRSARVNAASYDASVCAGWEERGDGPWTPVAWRDGTKLFLVASDSFGTAESVNFDGGIIVGASYEPSIITRVPTMWTWNGASYDMQRFNYLPGTVVGQGQAYFTGIADDGSIGVGSNIYTISPGGNRAGFVWTPAGGIVRDTDYLTSIGLLDQIPANFDIREFSAISPDGSTIAVNGLYADRFEYQCFLIRLTPPTPDCPGDANGDFIVDGADLSVLLSQFGQTVPPGSGADLNNDGAVNGADLSVLLANFNGGGCS